MKLQTVMMALTALFTAADACKCGGNQDATRACCRQVGGVPSGNDCPANTISERLSNFHSCCLGFGVRSDCRCPVGCLLKEMEAERRVQGLPELNDSEKLNYLTSYEGFVN
jgi:hypothetical protein